jgi:hypothetical protein
VERSFSSAILLISPMPSQARCDYFVPDGAFAASCRWCLLCLLLNFTFRLMSRRFRGSPWAVRQPIAARISAVNNHASAPAKIAIRRSDRLALAIARSSSRRSPVILPTVPFYSNLCIAALRNPSESVEALSERCLHNPNRHKMRRFLWVRPKRTAHSHFGYAVPRCFKT